ncbi:MAG TPA: transposase [Gaiellaceae bacterium]|nr:transposase [Gaiellaceae bacterium]
MFSRGNEHRAIYADDHDRNRFLETLTEAVERCSWRVLTYCLMDNHYHLLLQTPLPNLSKGMQYLNSVYAERFNRRHSRVGHVFQGRFKAVLVQSGTHLLTELRYVVRNRVRAGLCSGLDDWRWAGHAAVLGAAPAGVVDRSAVLALFDADPARALVQYRQLVEADGDVRRTAPYRLVLGDAAFVARYTPAAAPSLDLLVTDAADLAAIDAARAHGYSLAEIAAHLGIHKSTLSRRLRAAQRSGV